MHVTTDKTGASLTDQDKSLLNKGSVLDSPHRRCGLRGCQRYGAAILLLTTLCVALVPTASSTAQTGPLVNNAPTEDPNDADKTQALRWSRSIIMGFVLILVFLFSALIIVRFSRRFKEYVLHGRSVPTPYVDVWKLHRAPEQQNNPPAPPQDMDPDGASPPDPNGSGSPPRA